MQIDEAVEQHVRAAFSAVLGRDPEALKAALAKITPADFQRAVAYALYVIGYVALDVMEGELPDDGVAAMAQVVVEDTQDWADLGGVDTVAALIKAAARGDEAFTGVPVDDVPVLAFGVGGFLLTRYRREGQRWFEYLDDAWNATVASDGAAAPMDDIS